MKYSSDQQLVLMAVVDNVTLDRKRSNARAELRTTTTHPRLLYQEIESVDDGVNESVGGCGAAVLSDVGPDLLEVLLGQSGEPIGHLRLLGARRTTTRFDPLGELSA